MNVDQELEALLCSYERTPQSAARVEALITHGATLNPETGIPPLFLAVKGLNVPAVQALLAAGARPETRLASDWTEPGDEEDELICAAGLSVREFFARFEKEERKAKVPPQRAKWLQQVATLLASGKPAPKANRASKATTAAPKPGSAEARETLEGRWVEVLRSAGPRSSKVKDGAELVIAGETFRVKGSLAVGLPKKGTLSKRSARAAAYTDTDLEWSLVLRGDELVVTSPAEADEEHGIVYTATFERLAT